MQKIYLAKPGGQKEGPYTIEQINHDLAEKKYSDEDFWAWHEGLPAWIPLYSLPGVSAKVGTAAALEIEPEPKSAEAVAATETVTEPESKSVEEEIAIRAVVEADPVSVEEDAATEPVAKPEPEPVMTEAPTPAVVELEPELPEILATSSMSSGKPFSALEQIFVFTTGEGPSAFKSEVTTAMLLEAVGESLDSIRSKVPVDVIGGADAAALETIRGGSIPPSAWRALSAIKPAIAQQARDGMYHLCVRTFPVESNEVVALFLLYNKEKL